MDFFSEGRNDVVQALARGDAVSSAQAARFPDVILDKDASQIPEWLLPLIRRPTAPGGPRYVVADGQPFHVSLNGAGALVMEVEYFNQGGVRKVRHNPYRPTQEKIQAAVAAYDTVCRFVSDPNAFREVFSTTQDNAIDNVANPRGGDIDAQAYIDSENDKLVSSGEVGAVLKKSGRRIPR